MFSHSVSMTALGFAALFSIFGSATAQISQPIVLPAPQTSGGKPLMQALAERKTSRDFDSRALSDQMLSNLLWAACGINRPESGLRTAPTAMNWQEIDVYVALEKGLFLYEAKTNRLVPVLDKDIRANTGVQPFIIGAPVNLVFVADFARMGGADTATKEFYSATDTGCISQNVYLFCASEGLATVVRGYVDRKALAEVINLGPDQKIILAQTVGYPKP